ncbi:MAG: hypothetical protein K9K93_06600 [Acholeplasmataceae bacterium]|jgi:hypothetical protein|nr:hypothetical protein [Acholeplasmataceae bacterium]
MKYTRLLPFMDREELKTIANQIIDGEIKGVKIESLFPFLDKDTLHEIASKLIEKKDSRSLKRAIPFLGKSKVMEIFEAAQSGELEDFDTSSLLPFLGSDKIKELFYKSIKDAEDDPDEDQW